MSRIDYETFASDLLGAQVWMRYTPTLPSKNPTIMMTGVAAKAESVFEQKSSQSRARIQAPLAGSKSCCGSGLKGRPHYQ